MLRATDFFRKRLSVDDVKLLLIDACIECECDRITIVYAVEDADKVLTKTMTTQFFDRILDEDGMELLQDIDELEGIRKMYRIERMTADFDVVELKINH